MTGEFINVSEMSRIFKNVENHEKTKVESTVVTRGGSGVHRQSAQIPPSDVE